MQVIDKTQKGFYIKAVEKWYRLYPLSQLHNLAFSEKTVHCQGYDKMSKKMISVVFEEKDLFWLCSFSHN